MGGTTRKFSVVQTTTLTEWLRLAFPEISHTELKRWLSQGKFLVNGQATTNGGLLLAVGDQITQQQYASALRLPFPIVYQDESLIVISKPPGLLTMATESEKQQTAYHLLTESLKAKNHKPIFIVHRLDRETSGLLIFARNPGAKEKLQAEFEHQTAQRRYIAIVEGEVMPKAGTLEHFLAENQQHKVYIAPTGQGKVAKLSYQVQSSNKRYSRLEVTLQTGRRGQIRIQLAAIGHPIIGDEAAKTNPLKRLALHAHYLALKHPVTNKLMEFNSPPPDSFQKLV